MSTIWPDSGVIFSRVAIAQTSQFPHRGS
jgi:hypothetical protein